MTRQRNHADVIAEEVVPCTIHRTAILGERVTVWPYARILAECTIADEVSIGGGTEIGRGSVIGYRSRIGANVFLPPNSVIGQRVFVGPGCTFTDDRHPQVPLPGDSPYNALPPILEDDCVIGAGCVILPGVRIGRGAVIAAGCTVAKPVPNGCMVKGPAAQDFYPNEETEAKYRGLATRRDDIVLLSGEANG